MSSSQPSVRRSSRQAAPVRSYLEVDEADDLDDGDDEPDPSPDADVAFDDEDAADPSIVTSQRSPVRGRKRPSTESAAEADDADADVVQARKRPRKCRGRAAPASSFAAEAPPPAVHPADDEGSDGYVDEEDVDWDVQQLTNEQLADLDDLKVGRVEAGEEEGWGGDESKEPEAGVITSVQLTNFMVHQVTRSQHSAAAAIPVREVSEGVRLSPARLVSRCV